MQSTIMHYTDVHENQVSNRKNYVFKVNVLHQEHMSGEAVKEHTTSVYACRMLKGNCAAIAGDKTS